MYIYEYICIYICTYKGESKSFAFSLLQEQLPTQEHVMHLNEAAPLCIKSLLLNMVTFSLNSNAPPLNESMYSCLVKFCCLFFEPFHHFSFYFFITGINFASSTLFHGV